MTQYDNFQLSVLQQEIYDSTGCWVCNSLLHLKFKEKYTTTKGSKEDRIKQATERVKQLFV